MEEATKVLVGSGIWGALFVFIVIPLAIYAYRLSKAVEKVQEKRVEDTKALLGKVLEVSVEWNNTINALDSSSSKHHDAICALKDSVENLQKDVRDALLRFVEKGKGGGS
jgi:hypothetical protein